MGSRASARWEESCLLQCGDAEAAASIDHCLRYSALAQTAALEVPRLNRQRPRGLPLVKCAPQRGALRIRCASLGPTIWRKRSTLPGGGCVPACLRCHASRPSLHDVGCWRGGCRRSLMPLPNRPPPVTDAGDGAPGDGRRDVGAGMPQLCVAPGVRWCDAASTPTFCLVPPRAPPATGSSGCPRSPPLVSAPWLSLGTPSGPCGRGWNFGLAVSLQKQYHAGKARGCRRGRRPPLIGVPRSAGCGTWVAVISSAGLSIQTALERPATGCATHCASGLCKHWPRRLAATPLVIRLSAMP